MSTLTRRVKAVPRRAVTKPSNVASKGSVKSGSFGSTPDEQFRPTSDSDTTTNSEDDSSADEQRGLARGNQNPRPQRGTRRPLAAPTTAPTKRKLVQEEPEEEYKDDALMQVLSLIVPRFEKTSPWPIRLLGAAMVGMVGVWIYAALIIFSD